MWSADYVKHPIVSSTERGAAKEQQYEKNCFILLKFTENDNCCFAFSSCE